MKNNYLRITVLFTALFTFYSIFPQMLDVELLNDGTFGTIYTVGKNGDDINENTPRSQSIYPKITDNTIPVYYQPVKWGFYGWYMPPFVNVEEYTNKNVTFGYPIGNQTLYQWGMIMADYSVPVYFPTVNNTNSEVRIPTAIDATYYLVTTSTRDMYKSQSINGIIWKEIYDKYETDTIFPTNYFLIFNGKTESGILYQKEINLEPGRIYRLGADVCRLDKTSYGKPQIAFEVGSDDSNFDIYTSESIESTGNWIRYEIDFIAPETGTTYIALSSKHTESYGNDIAIDNISLKAIKPIIKAETSCNETILSFNAVISNAFQTNTYHFQWQVFNENTNSFENIPEETSNIYTTNKAGTYMLLVYPNDAENNPMQSNIITTIIPDECMEIKNMPKARNDKYIVRPGTDIERNILNNDSTSTSIPALESNTISVVSFEYRNSIYSANETIILYNSENKKIGNLTINSDGKLLFYSTSDCKEIIQDINYTILEEGGGYSTAGVRIELLIDYTLNTNASCTSCPIEVWISKPEIYDATDTIPCHFSIERVDKQAISELDVTCNTEGNPTMKFTFKDFRSGNNYYSILQNGKEIVSFSILVKPRKVLWEPNPIADTIINNDWDNELNWVSLNGAGTPPIWCTDVVISADVLYYPEIRGDKAECRDITFETGSSVGQIHKLRYRRAFVNYKPETDKWSLTTAPLKYLYSADFHADSSWGAFAGIEPRIYMRYFDVEYSTGTMTNPDDIAGYCTGNFCTPFASLKEELKIGHGFALNMGETNSSCFDGIFKLPRSNKDGSDITYMYHYSDNGEWIINNSAGDKYKPFTLYRGNEAVIDSATWISENTKRLNDSTYVFNLWGSDNRFRFIYETSHMQNIINSDGNSVLQLSLPVKSSNEETTIIVGNPFMSHINFDKFYQDNADAIQPYYRTFDGTSYHSFLITDSEGSPVWQGNNEEIISTIDHLEISHLISPMQAFLIDLKPNKNSLKFIPDHISTVPDYDNTTTLFPIQTKAVRNISENILKLRLKMGEIENTTIVASLPMASDTYKPGEDIYKLFPDETSIRNIKNSKFYPADIYTIADNTAIEINAVSTEGNEKTIPIGIKTAQTGNAIINIEGNENFTAFDEILFLDVIENKTYNIRQNTNIFFEKISEENIEGRFYLLLKNTEINALQENNHTNTDIHLFTGNGSITISTPTTQITDIELFDISGRIIYQQNNIYSMYENLSPAITKGVYIINVKTIAGNKEFKVFI